MSVVTKDTIQPSSGQPLTIKDEGGTASITVATNGEATFAENIKITSSKGIDFSNQTALSGMTAELLDHYEEGTYEVTSIPTSGGGSVPIMASYKTLSYVKIGNIVHVGGELIVSGVSTGTDGALNVPLPFAVKSQTQQAGYWRGTVNIFSVNIDSGAVDLCARANPGQSYFDMLLSKDDASYSSIWGSAITANSRIGFSLSYISA